MSEVESIFQISAWIKTLRWDDHSDFLFNKFNSVSVSIPIIGYYILFNDAILISSGFSKLIGDVDTTFFLSNSARLKLIYFGMVLIGLFSLLANFRRPRIMSRGRNQKDFLAFAKENYTLQDIIHCQEIIKKWGPSSNYGVVDEREWETFLATCLVKKISRTSTEKFAEDVINSAEGDERRDHSFLYAMNRHESMIREILIDYFIREVTARKISLIASLTGILAGYLLLAIPSLDLFLRVCEATIF